MIANVHVALPSHRRCCSASQELCNSISPTQRHLSDAEQPLRWKVIEEEYDEIVVEVVHFSAASQSVGSHSTESSSRKTSRPSVRGALEGDRHLSCLETADCAYHSPQHSPTHLSSTTLGTTAAGRAGNARKYAWTAAEPTTGSVAVSCGSGSGEGVTRVSMAVAGFFLGACVHSHRVACETYFTVLYIRLSHVARRGVTQLLPWHHMRSLPACSMRGMRSPSSWTDHNTDFGINSHGPGPKEEVRAKAILSRVYAKAR